MRINTDSKAIFKLILFLWKLPKKFSFFLFPFSLRKLKGQRASWTQRELICAVTSIPWSHSGQITCRVLIFHVYSLHHIFTTGAKYVGIDVLSYSLEQSSTVSTAHSGCQTQSSLTQAVPAVWCFSLVHTEKALLCSLCTTACSLSFVFQLLCCNCAWPCSIVQSTCLTTAETQKWERAVKARRRRGVSVSTLFVCERHLSIFDSA